MLLNLDMMKEWVNWVTLFLMVFIAMILFHLVMKWETQPGS